ncbi:MAG: ADP-ribosylation factor-like protein [Promethearchaeota archaeon]
MKILVLSYFDPINGPTIYFKAPKEFNNVILNCIPPLMDLEEEGFFVHVLDDSISGNLSFEIKRRGARGGIEMFMVSLLLYKEFLNPMLLEDVLKEFVKEFNEIEDVYKGINVKKKEDNIKVQKAEEIKDFFYSFYQDLPEETIFMDKNAGILVFGLLNSGKTTLITSFKELLLEKKKLPNISNAERFFFFNLAITTYDLPIKRKFGELWKYYIKTIDGLVYVIDASKPDKFEEAKSQLYLITEHIKDKSIPLLILFNKKDIKNLEIQEAIANLELQKLDFRSIKCFETCALTKEGIKKAFDWLAKKILRWLFA